MQETKECPFCAEVIKAAAIKCKHCKTMLEDAVQEISDDLKNLPKEPEKANSNLEILSEHYSIEYITGKITEVKETRDSITSGKVVGTAYHASGRINTRIEINNRIYYDKPDGSKGFVDFNRDFYGKAGENISFALATKDIPLQKKYRVIALYNHDTNYEYELNDNVGEIFPGFLDFLFMIIVYPIIMLVIGVILCLLAYLIPYTILNFFLESQTSELWSFLPAIGVTGYYEIILLKHFGRLYFIDLKTAKNLKKIRPAIMNKLKSSKF